MHPCNLERFDKCHVWISGDVQDAILGIRRIESIRAISPKVDSVAAGRVRSVPFAIDLRDREFNRMEAFRWLRSTPERHYTAPCSPYVRAAATTFSTSPERSTSSGFLPPV